MSGPGLPSIPRDKDFVALGPLLLYQFFHYPQLSVENFVALHAVPFTAPADCRPVSLPRLLNANFWGPADAEFIADREQVRWTRTSVRGGGRQRRARARHFCSLCWLLLQLSVLNRLYQLALQPSKEDAML